MTTTIEALQLACPEMREIEFENIRKGDLIARYHSDGDVLVRTAFRRADGSYWVDKAGCVVAERSKIASHYLLHRPKLELPAEPGAMVRVKFSDYNEINLRLQSNGQWLSLETELHYSNHFFDELNWERVYLTTQEPDDV